MGPQGRGRRRTPRPSPSPRRPRRGASPSSSFGVSAAPLARRNVREPSSTARTRLDSPRAAERLPNRDAATRSDSVRTQNASAFSASAKPPASTGFTRSPRTPRRRERHREVRAVALRHAAVEVETQAARARARETPRRDALGERETRIGHRHRRRAPERVETGQARPIPRSEASPRAQKRLARELGRGLIMRKSNAHYHIAWAVSSSRPMHPPSGKAPSSRFETSGPEAEKVA